MKRRTIGDIILLSLEKTIDGYVRLEDFLYNTHLYTNGYDRVLKKSSLSKSLERLRIKGYINLDYFEKNKIIKINKSGYELAQAIKRFDKPWDGKWRIVIFDVPEEHKKLRNLIRYHLKNWEFTQLQKSVWISKKDVVPEIEQFIKSAGIEKWVKVFVADEII